jgi:hypothetical protein
MRLLRKGDLVAISPNFPESKLRIVGLTVGARGIVEFVMRTSANTPGIAIVKWDNGRCTNANEDHLEIVN